MGAGVRQQLRVKPRGAPGADIDRHRTHEEADPVHEGGAPSAGRRVEGGLRPKVHRVERAETSNELAGKLYPVEGEERRLELLQMRVLKDNEDVSLLAFMPDGTEFLRKDPKKIIADIKPADLLVEGLITLSDIKVDV